MNVVPTWPVIWGSEVTRPLCEPSKDKNFFGVMQPDPSNATS
jgi:hypothetical protein